MKNSRRDPDDVKNSVISGFSLPRVHTQAGVTVLRIEIIKGSSSLPQNGALDQSDHMDRCVRPSPAKRAPPRDKMKNPQRATTVGTGTSKRYCTAYLKQEKEDTIT